MFSKSRSCLTRLALSTLLPLLAAGVLSGAGVAQAAGETVLRQWLDGTAGRHAGFVATPSSPAGPAESADTWLVALNGHTRSGVVEVDASGKVVWEYPGQANSAIRLAGGHTLIADSGAPGPPFVPRVVEVEATGRVVWQYILPGRGQAPQYADRLADGNTLVVTRGEVLEVTPAGEVAWRAGAAPVDSAGSPAGRDWPGLVRAGFAARLASGNTLVVDRGLPPFAGGRVLEVDPAGRVVWQYGDGSRGTGRGQLVEPSAALRLPDGGTLIADLGSARLLQVTAAGEVVRVNTWREALAERGASEVWFARPLPDSSVLVSASFACGGSGVLLVDGGSIQTYLDGELLYTEVAPLLRDGQTLVPLRDVFEALGAGVAWDQATRTVTASRGSRVVSLTIGRSQALVDGVPIELAVAPLLYADRIMVPLRFLAEALGAEVGWDQASHTVSITSGPAE